LRSNKVSVAGAENMENDPAMPLANGTRLGPFEILTALGAGGPASARVQFTGELRRGLAVAKEAST